MKITNKILLHIIPAEYQIYFPRQLKVTEKLGANCLLFLFTIHIALSTYLMDISLLGSALVIFMLSYHIL